MKFYKLELINREQSYNQMFGTNPNVGLLPTATGKASKPPAGAGVLPIGKQKSGQPMMMNGGGMNNMMS